MALYRKEKIFLTSSCFISILLLIKFIARDKIRQATIAFLFQQALSWIFGLFAAENQWIRYPYRPFFKKAFKANFVLQYFLYPLFSIFFNLYYPETRNLLTKALYYFLHSSFITGCQLWMAKYTKLIRYLKWTWYYSFLTMWISYYLSHKYYQWLFRIDSKSVKTKS